MKDCWIGSMVRDLEKSSMNHHQEKWTWIQGKLKAQEEV